MADRSPHDEPTRRTPAQPRTPGGATRKAEGSAVPGRRWSVRALKGVTVGLLIAMIAGVIGIGVVYTTIDIPDPNAEFRANTSFVTYADGSQMGNFAIQNRQSIPYDQMPQSMKDAAIAAENRTFWSDRGISVTGMVRAAITIARGGEMQGGSTITQQYIKILYLNSERTFERKFKELFLAVKMGRQVPKEEILEGYLNTIYFGRGAYGIQAASKAYFNINADQLDVPQSAFLATVLNNPGAFNPSEPENQQRILDRYRYVLAGMEEMGTVTPEEAQRFSTELPEFPEVPLNRRYAGPTGYLMKMVENELAAKGFSDTQISGGGLRIVTTFDPGAQRAVEQTAQKYTQLAAENARPRQDPADLHLAIASVDNATGEVIALYGGPDYVANNRNWATTPRQTASTFKTFALAAGLKDGFNLYNTFSGNTFTPRGDSVPSRNQNGQQYGGSVNLIEATAKSINTAFVDMTTQMRDGGEKIAQAAEDAGLPRGAGWDTATSRIALGIAEASPLNMAGGYATFANNGRAVAPHVVREVFDADGRSIYQADTEGRQAFEEGVARDVTFAMRNVVEGGTGSRVATLGRPIAGKTGTSGLNDDIISAWFVAYTKQISTSVMFVAGDDGMGGLHAFRRPGDGTFYGGSYPAMVWNEYMRSATRGQPVEQFDPPAFVNRNNSRQTWRPRAPQPQNQNQNRTQAPRSTSNATTRSTTQAPTPGHHPATDEGSGHHPAAGRSPAADDPAHHAGTGTTTQSGRQRRGSDPRDRTDRLASVQQPPEADAERRILSAGPIRLWRAPVGEVRKDAGGHRSSG
ncbi:MAG: transglycosylase domain-containing protein [Propionibacteriaceae bacterium]|nr:transglycosylase domain-containing protein [Propionibacteriaceae bacterium]